MGQVSFSYLRILLPRGSGFHVPSHFSVCCSHHTTELYWWSSRPSSVVQSRDIFSNNFTYTLHGIASASLTTFSRLVAFRSPSLIATLQPLGGPLFFHSLLKICFPLGPVLNLLPIAYPLPGRFYSLPSLYLTLNKYKVVTHKSLSPSQIAFWGSRSIYASIY